MTLSQRVFSLCQLAEENPGLGSELASIMGTVIDACHRRGLVDSPRQSRCQPPAQATWPSIPEKRE
ncbi:MAG: hypothetical protein HY744_33840 [Deltaproteobacteria bacterium]|nr:hypothetical protein [Deltaproteobacteria bacterium]